MRRILFSALALAAASGCATTGSAAVQQMYGGTGTLNGVITLPEQAVAGVANPCEGLELRVFRTDSPAESVGKVTLRQSRNRCSYQVTKLPEGAPVAVELKSEGWACATGTTLTLTPAVQAVTFGAHETRTKDFAATCATAANEQQQPTPNAG